MDIYETFRNKTIFFTGVTGFVGKVFLWKVLKEFPDMESIVVLVRTKKGQNPVDRLNKEVLSSPCFEPLKKALGDEEWKRRSSKVVPVSGDIMFDRLGLSDNDYNMVVAKTHLIVHMAATVNFDERLDVSVKMNVLGSMRVMAIAQKSPKLLAFVHMSTCYVNYNRNGRHQVVRETIYPLPFDADDMCKFILAQDPALIQLVTDRVLKQYGFPNTYTLTKSMGEQILERRKGNLPLTIIRPAIIGCAWREPMPGWVDALTAAGGIYLMAGLGILKEMHCRGANAADIIPVDYVVNSTLKLLHRTHTYYAIQKGEISVARSLPSAAVTPLALPIAAAAGKRDAIRAFAPTASSAAAVAPKNGVSSGASNGSNGADSVGELSSLPFVYQASTSSSLNLMRWETAVVAVVDYWGKNPHPKAVAPPDMTLVENWYAYQFRFITRRVIPVAALKVVSNLPIVGGPDKKKLVARLERAVFRGVDMQRQFTPFMNNEWCFDNTNTNSLDESLKSEHVKAFSCDVYDINWHAYTVAYSYGMIKYIMKAGDGRSQPLMPESGSEVFMKASL